MCRIPPGRALGRIWAATDAGVAVFDATSLHARALGFIDGVGESGYWADAVTQDKDGTLFFGGADGITVIAPGASSPWSYAPPLVVTELTVGTHQRSAGGLNAGKPLDLPPDARAFSAAFAALDYSEPASIQYAYKLDGFDRDWTDAGARRTAYYTNIPPGNYRFTVIACNNDGVWNHTGASASLSIAPHFYQTITFKVVILALLGVLCFGVDRLRVSRVTVRGSLRSLAAAFLRQTSALCRAMPPMVRKMSGR